MRGLLVRHLIVVNIKTSNIILYCKKWKDTVAFYKKVLKLQVNFSNEWFVEFNLNDTARLSVANENKSSIKSSGGKGITISLKVDDIKTMYSDMVESGINPSPIKNLWESRLFYINDPEGNRIEFWNHLERALSTEKTSMPSKNILLPDL